MKRINRIKVVEKNEKKKDRGGIEINAWYLRIPAFDGTGAGGRRNGIYDNGLTLAALSCNM